MRILHIHGQTDLHYRLRRVLTFDIRAHVRWAGSKVCRFVRRARQRSGYIYYCCCVIKSARNHYGVSGAIRMRTEHEVFEWRRTHFAGHPNVKFVLDTRVVGSSISSRTAPSNAGSHSCRSSEVAKIDFQTSKGIVSSAVGTSRTTLYTVSSDLADLRCTITSDSSGRDERPFPLEANEVFSLGRGTRFQSGEEVEVRRCLKEVCASFSALYHACRRLQSR